MKTLNWSNMSYKNPCPTTLKYDGENVTDNRFVNYRELYNEDQMNMLQHFENFQITDTIYDTNNPWTIAEANSQSDYATHLLRQANFNNGAFRIVKPAITN